MFSEGNVFAFKDSNIQVDHVLETKRRKAMMNLGKIMKNKDI